MQSMPRSIATGNSSKELVNIEWLTKVILYGDIATFVHADRMPSFSKCI